MIEIQSFVEHLGTLCPDFRSKKYLLAISGGVDSMVMLHLFSQSGLSFAVAHCNFQLRGAESQRDMDFVFRAATDTGCRVFEKNFDTAGFARKNHLNIQEAARKLRYDFFRETASTQGFDYICTAHNRNDVIETLLMGLNRRGSLTTLAGIREIENSLLRPLLNYPRSDIEAYAANHMISWTEDSSNKSDKYLRNRIRHHIVPELENTMPGFCSRAASSVALLREYEKFFAQVCEAELKKMGDPRTEGIQLGLLRNHPHSSLLLMHFLLRNGFFPSDAQAILSIGDSSEPRLFLSPQFKLFVHRDRLTLVPIQETDNNELWYIDEDLDTGALPFRMTASWSDVSGPDDIKTGKNTALLSAEEIKFPLLIRKWKAGDRFQPLGMHHSKKIGDFFTDLKTTLPERDSAYILCSGNDVAWLVGYRIDQRFSVKSFPTKVLKLCLL